MFVRLLIALVVVGGAFGPAQPVSAGGTDRLPDLTMEPLVRPYTETVGSQRRLRFGTIMANRGDGPLEVLGSRTAGQNNMTTRQRIYDTAGGNRLVNSRALMEYARDGHDHWHIQGVMLYQLWSANGTTKRGAKVGFCFLDSTSHIQNRPANSAPWKYGMARCGTQSSTSNSMGLSVGWGDDYPGNFAYQWIDITALPPGDYTVQARADEQNWYVEKNESNNCAWSVVRITASNGPLQVLSQGKTCLTPPGATAKVERQYGDDRYQTAGAVSEDAFAPGVPVAYVATGEAFPDAISAAAAAGAGGGPVILVQENFLPALAITELERLNPARIVVVGGPGAISNNVFTMVGKYQTGGGTTRVYGASRYDTSAEVSEKTFAPGVPVAYVASGENWPDAISAAPHAANAGAPLLITRQGSVPASIAAELERLDPAQIIVAGGPAAISNAVVAQLDAYDTGGGVVRVYGQDRYGTAAELAQHHYPGTAAFAYVATGSNFPDALAAGPAAAKRNAPVLLTRRTSVPAETAAELNRLNPKRIYVLGGAKVIAPSMDATFQQWASGGP